jgi:MinD-like ATPase involved in chromosome partitioning or flagellar assembly
MIVQASDVQGGRAVDGTETGWGRPAEPAPRWRALLDRARHGRNAEEPADEERETPPAPASYGQPLPTRPVPAERRTFNPHEVRAAFDPQLQYEREQQYEPPRTSEARTPEARAPEARNPEPRPIPQRPVNPLDPRWQARQAEAVRQAEVNAPPRNFFSPARPSAPVQPPPVQPPPVQPAPVQPAPAPLPPAPLPPAQAAPVQAPPVQAPPIQRDYPQVRAAVSAPVAPPPMAPVAPAMPSSMAPSPTSPAPARIEWRQSRPDEEIERAVSLMRRKLGKPRVLAFANPKGGVHKTTATVLAAATIGSVRGRGVLAWDDNELRGTLGLRAGSARHARTIKHLLADLMQIESLHGDGLIEALDGYLRHASDGSYDVLAGEENPRFAQRLDQDTVRRVMDLLRRTHDVICVDTGNNVESVNWQTVMRQADQLVITTVPREDAAFTADWMLDVLDESGMGDLVANAVTLISCPSPGPLPLLDDFAKHFATRTRAVAVVPYDPALEVGSSIEYQELQLPTRQAWLKAASVMIEPFAE